MAVIVNIECQTCESIEKEEFEGVLVLGKTHRNGELGTKIIRHDLENAGVAEMLADALEDLANKLKTEG